MRCFVAVDLDEKLKPVISNLQTGLRGLDTSLTPENNLHFTLKFLGEINEKGVSRIKEALAGIAASTEPFSITLAGVGVFPSEKFVRVVWVGCSGREFIDLHYAVADALKDYEKTEKPVPHLTLARVKSPRYTKEILSFVDANRNKEFGSMKVDKIKLKSSTLTSRGAAYKDAAVFNLG